VHDSLVTAAFSGLFLLKMASLFPAELDLGAIIGQVEHLAQLLSEVAAERYVPRIAVSWSLIIKPNRYALTLRIMLANLRRKVGLNSEMDAQVPTLHPPSFAEGSAFNDPKLPAPFTMEELGFAGPVDQRMFNPSDIPLWLQEKVC
jgi:hypothetical protein